ncbi:HEXXH motif domain-containing protein [Actinoallomurus soli]|uniref:HEXXH motif domain-containing protein n=1 Tax=Actinoallomurus soli TaxID=2952535 RepID=UPI0020923710|nr:HEXXH motif domain-containing protein [Actinoallomurus soli]MCO5973805.1 HEXXH motif domain-containing protein [Actinoallomurus soli]
MRRHELPGKVFFALAAGGGGAFAIGHLQAAQYSKRLLLLRAVRDRAMSGEPERARRARRAYALLAEIQERSPDAVDVVLRYPTAGAWARTATMGPADADGLTVLAASAAVHARHPRPVRVPIRAGTVVLPSLGRAVLPVQEGTAIVQPGAGSGRARITVATAGRNTGAAPSVDVPLDPHRDGPGWQGLRRLHAEYHGMALRLLLDDIDPYRLAGAGVSPSRVDAAELETWEAALRRAWRLLVRHHWTAAEEVAAALSVATPLLARPDEHTSATALQSFGCIGISYPWDDHSLAVAFAHEIQHAKLGALTDIVSLVEPDDGSRYYAPWRDDPRPASGLLHGVYAHLGVAGYWRRQRAHEDGHVAFRAHSEFSRWRDAAALGARVLRASGRLTEEGELFVAETSRTLSRWCREPVPVAALDRARTAAREHRARWQAQHGEPPGVGAPAR